ncbi:MAG: hypothetical protein ACJ71T_13935 [Actinomycetales bacterium]
MDFEEQVAVAMHATAERVTPPVERLVRGGAQRGQELRGRRTRYAVGLGGAVGALAVVAVALGAGLGRDSASTPPAAQPTSSSSAVACGLPVRTDALPEWARAGFTNPEAGGVPWVTGSDGKIVAVLFGQPLSAPEAKDHANKILWVSRQAQVPLAPLVVTATARGALRPQPVTVSIPGGPGPSYLDLPYPGCWHLDLAWDNGKQHDAMDLAYVKGAR